MSARTAGDVARDAIARTDRLLYIMAHEPPCDEEGPIDAEKWLRWEKRFEAAHAAYKEAVAALTEAIGPCVLGDITSTHPHNIREHAEKFLRGES